MKKPYSNSKADPARSQKRIREMLIKFGVDRVGFDEDLLGCVLIVRFVYKNYPVSLPMDYGKLAEMYIKEDPWTERKFKNEDEWNAGKREVAYRASFSLIEDFLKSLITIVEMGMFTFEEIFISYFTNSMGERLGPALVKKLDKLVGDRPALKEGGTDA